MRNGKLLVLIFIVWACDKHEDFSPEDNVKIYLNRFVSEAAQRGITIDPTTISITFVPASEIAPYAGYGNTNPPRVRLVMEKWLMFDDNQREVLMFHELGHAVLYRAHTNEMLPNCDYKSIMMDGNQFFIYSDGSNKREYYINELFNPLTPYPVWAGPSKQNKTVVMEDGIVNQSDWTFHAVDGSLQVGNVNEQVYLETPNSLSIEGASAGEGRAFWYLPVPVKTFPVGSTLVLSVDVKTEGVVGGFGAMIGLQADVDKNRYFNTSTAFYGTIIGTHDFTNFQLTLNCYPDDKPALFIYLMMDGRSTGKVYFDNIKVDNFN